MQLKFEGQTHSIEANTLINALVHYQNIAVEANKQLSGGARQIRINVNAIEKGSFIIDLSLVQNVVETIFGSGTMSYLADLNSVIDGVYKLYKKFRGKPIKTEEDKQSAITIVLQDNASLIINTYNNPIVRENISKTIETADADVNVDGFSLVSNEAKTTFEKSEFKDYIYSDFDNEEAMPLERIKEEDVELVILGLNFEKGSRWQFMYNGFKIFIIVKDDALMAKIDEGARFGKGDAIKVKLRTIQKYNKEYKTYENKSYKIIEFYEHIIFNKPINLDLFEE